MVELTRVKMIETSVLPIIEKYREGARDTIHSMSKSCSTGPIPCTDIDVMKFLQKLDAYEPDAELTISDIEWEEFGNCVGDELYPVKMEAVLLPDQERYFLTVSGLKMMYECEEGESPGEFVEEYILVVD